MRERWAPMFGRARLLPVWSCSLGNGSECLSLTAAYGMAFRAGVAVVNSAGLAGRSSPSCRSTFTPLKTPSEAP